MTYPTWGVLAVCITRRFPDHKALATGQAAGDVLVEHQVLELVTCIRCNHPNHFCNACQDALATMRKTEEPAAALQTAWPNHQV